MAVDVTFATRVALLQYIMIRQVVPAFTLWFGDPERRWGLLDWRSLSPCALVAAIGSYLDQLGATMGERSGFYRRNLLIELAERACELTWQGLEMDRISVTAGSSFRSESSSRRSVPRR